MGVRTPFDHSAGASPTNFHGVIIDQAKLPLYSAATNEVEIRTRTIDEIHLPLEKTLFQLLANPAFTNELRLLVRYYDTVGGSDGAYGAGSKF